MTSRLFHAVLLVVVVSSPIVRAAPAFVAAPAIPEDDEDAVLDRQERAASGGGGSGAYGYDNDDEDYKYTRRVRKPDIHHFHVDASITARFSSTLINSMLVNTEEYAQEATFSVVLPTEAFISKFVMVIEGVAYEAEVKEKEKAQREYDAAKERGQTAGQVKQHETKPNTFSVSVNVAAYSGVVFNLTYQELLHRRHGVIEYNLKLDPGQVVRSLKVDIHITEPQGLQEMDASWVSAATGQNVMNDVIAPLKDAVYVDRLSQNRAHIKFHPSKDQQKTEGGEGVAGHVLVKYDVLHDLSAGNLQVMNGYFVHYFSPEGMSPARKNVVFVIDVSGSMGGSKIQQTREALTTILGDIREGDRLNIVTFTDYIEVWKPDEMVLRSDQYIDEALEFTDGLRALYGTNLHDGLMAGIDLLKAVTLADEQIGRDAYSLIIMLTDGLPSTGVTNQNQIRDNVLGAIDGKFSLFCLGFGNDLDHSFLDNLASENQGVARRIYTDSSATLQLQGFYNEVATPLLFNVNIEYNHVADSTQTNFLSYFDGTEIIVAGQLGEELTVRENGQTELVASVSANSMDTFIQLDTKVDVQGPGPAALSRHAVDDFCQRLWAYLTIKSLLKSRQVSRDREEKEELKARALELSLKYHFVTPLTSLLVVRPEEVDQVPPPIEGAAEGPEAAEDVAAQVPAQHPAMKQSSPSGHVPQRPASSGGARGGGGGGGGFADSDPHFVVHVPASDVTVCFDILGQDGEVYNLLTDKALGLEILGLIVAAPDPVPGTQYTRTYFGRIIVKLGGRTVHLSTKDIIVDDSMVLSWKNNVAVHRGNWSVAVRNKQVEITSADGSIGLAFMLHHMNPLNTFKVDHLGFYIVNNQGLTDHVHGLIGQFKRRQVHIQPHSEPRDGVTGELAVADRLVDVVQRSRLNSMVGHKVSCWFAANNAHGLIDGSPADYLVPLWMMQ